MLTFLFTQTESLHARGRDSITGHFLRDMHVLGTLLGPAKGRVRGVPFDVCQIVHKIQIKIVENGDQVSSLDFRITS